MFQVLEACLNSKKKEMNVSFICRIHVGKGCYVSQVANNSNYSKASNKTLAFQNLSRFSENVVNSFSGKFIIKTMIRQCSRHLTKMKFSIMDFFSKCDHIRSFLPILSHLKKKFLKENLIFRAVKTLHQNEIL